MSSDDERQLIRVKKKLKAWEAGFVSEHNRKPGKDDIANSETDIQDAYKEYANLKRKTADLSNESMVASDAWGTDLNKSSQAKKCDVKVSEKAKGITEKTSLMSKLGKKLLEKATATPVRAPSWGISKSLSEPRKSGQNIAMESTCYLNKISKLNSFNNKIPDEKLPQKEDLPSSKSNFLSALDKANISMKVLPKRTDDDLVPFTISSQKKNLTEKYKFVNQFDSKKEIVETVTTKIDNDDDLWDDDFPDIDKPFESIPMEPDDLEMEQKEIMNSVKKVECNTIENHNPIQLKSWSEINKPVSRPNPIPEDEKENGNVSKRGQKRKNDDELEVGENDSGKKSRIAGEPIRRGRKAAKKKSSDEIEDEEDNWLNSGVCVVSWKPDQQPNAELDQDMEEASPVSETKTKPARAKTTTRGRGGIISNDNFVRLNMKLKTYKRKGGHMTGGKYKRMQWKEKMKQRSESFGNKCFKCGQEGHWANKCKGKSQPKVPEMECGDQTSAVDDSDFPTLREAMGMSQGIRTTSTTAVQPDKPPQTEIIESCSPPASSKKSKKRTTEKAVLPQDDDLDLEFEIYRQSYEAPVISSSMEPYYSLNEDGSLPEPTDEVMAALAKFGFSSFKPGQKEALMRILCGLSTLVVLSTGSGKSLCYQLPAYILATQRKAITLVISPLVSLMEDQVTGLPPGVNGYCLHTNMTQVQRKKVVERVAAGDVHFLLISPEAMTSSSNAHSLLGTAQLPPIAFACIDEAHCVSEWSHHFRPSYLRICKVLRETFGVNCLLGLTATATMVTAASVSQHLNIPDYRTSTIRDLPVPGNLNLSVSRDDNKDDALLALLQGERFGACYSIIIYCTRRQETERVATLIRTCMKDSKTAPVPEIKGKGKGKAKKLACDGSWSAESYHAGMTAAARRRVQKTFMTGHLRVVVATVAFGMGVDKSDVRGIIHYSLPKSFESYVQEIGRAGRDGKPSHCHLFLDSKFQDVSELKRHIYSNTIDRFIIKKLVRKLFIPCKCREKHNREHNVNPDAEETEYVRVCPSHERALPIDATVQELDIREEGIATLLCYLELHPKAWLINLQHAYGTCTIQCYGGAPQLQAIAKQCPPVAVAIAKQQKKGASFAKANMIEFPVVDISDSMGWESGPVKRELKLLQWNLQHSGGASHKTGVVVTFTDLAFHVRSYGDLSVDDIEEVVSFLSERIQTQERTELGMLHRLQTTLRGVSHKDVWMCADRVDMDRSEKLKKMLRDYFDEQPEFKDGQVTMLSFGREYGSQDQTPGSVLEKIEGENLSQARSDIQQFINVYGHEHTLTGRVIARIFHGIPSPVFPAEVWGRVRRFWRCHLDTDFNLLRKLATQELIHIR